VSADAPLASTKADTMNNTIPKPAAASFSHMTVASARCLYVLVLFQVEHKNKK
jgi:hypothetical protein